MQAAQWAIICSTLMAWAATRNTTTRDFSLTLHVVDFSLTAPAPGSVTANRSSVSGPVAFQVAAAGAFNQTVALSCSGLPAGATCNFQPSSSASPISGQPVNCDPDDKRRRNHALGYVSNYAQRLGRWRAGQNTNPVADGQHWQHRQSQLRAGDQQSVADYKSE